MRTVIEHIRSHLLCIAGVRDRSLAPSPQDLRKTQWCPEYEDYRRNRMVMGFFRYGDIHRQSLSSYDLPQEAITRVRRYQRDHNLEHLVDAGNILMLAYMQGRKQGQKFISQDDSEHAQPKGAPVESNLD